MATLEIKSNELSNNMSVIRTLMELGKNMSALPNNQSCTSSGFPEKIWCIEYKRPAMTSICENCPKYENKYLSTKN